MFFALAWCLLTPKAFLDLFYSLFCLVIGLFRYFAVLATGNFSLFSKSPLPFDYSDVGSVKSPISPDQGATSAYFSSSISVLFNKDYFMYSLSGASLWLSGACRVLMLITMFIPIFFLAGKEYLSPNKNALCYRTKPLKLFDRLEAKAIDPAKIWLKGLLKYFKDHRWMIVGLIMSAAFCFGVISFVLDFFTYYLAFFISLFDFSIIYKGLASGAALLWPLIKLLGWFGVCALLYLLFDFIRCKIGTRKQYEMREKNKEFISNIGVTVILTGPPDKGKTLTNASISRTKDEMNREAIRKKIIIYCMNAFPKFRWSAFYADMESKMSDGKQHFKNLGSIDNWFSANESQWVEANNKKDFELARKLLWGYDTEKEPSAFYNELHVMSINEAVKVCAEGYFLFRSEKPLLKATFPQQCFYSYDFSNGIIPKIVYKVFDVDYRTEKGKHMCVHFDMNEFRLIHPISDKKDNSGYPITLEPKDVKEVGIIEPLVYSAQEINKIYGNKNDGDTTAKNADGFRTTVSIFRHLGTLMNMSLIMLIVDSQKMSDTSIALTSRFESELSIIDSDKNFKTTLPLWIFTKWISEGLIAFHDWFLQKYCENRKDEALFMTLWDRANHFLFTRYQRRYNRWRFIRERILGTNHINENSAETTESIYFIIPKDDFGDKYATDNLKKELSKFKSDRPDSSWTDAGTFEGLYLSDKDEKSIHSYFSNSIGN